jgi:hypothetical protein
MAARLEQVAVAAQRLVQAADERGQSRGVSLDQGDGAAFIRGGLKLPLQERRDPADQRRGSARPAPRCGRVRFTLPASRMRHMALSTRSTASSMR